MAVSTDCSAPCSDASPQPHRPSSVEILTNSQLHQSTQCLKVSTLVIFIGSCVPLVGFAVFLMKRFTDDCTRSLGRCQARRGDAMPRRKSADRKPTIIDVAKRAGVSLGTASNVLNNGKQVHKDLRARVH